MMISTILLASACAAPAALDLTADSRALTAQGATVTWTAPVNHVVGGSFPVELKVTAPKGSSVPGAWLSPDGFTVDGKALGGPNPGFDARVDLDLSLSFDLGPFLDVTEPFTLGLTNSAETKAIGVFQTAPTEVDFMTMPIEELANYGVLLRTNQGDMLVELWSETAPNHARNFLDLSYTGFYDGVLFHRCIPGFVIQGGDPTTKDPTTDPRRYGMGNGPRKLDAEFSERLHERGVLSAARLGGDVNSATSQFFICHARVASLDRQYTAFGELRFGLEVMDAIVNAPKAIDEGGPDPRTGRPRRVASDRPAEAQIIQHAHVVVLPSKD